MATPLSADRLLAALRAEGCRVTEYRDWRTHNRNHKGPWGSVHGVMIHHTVTSGTEASVRLCYEGRSDLPGPLSHSVGAKDGRIYMIGHGRANHAGLGDDDVLAAVIAERSLPAVNEANTDGNRSFYGIELINLGDGKDPWPEAQVDAAARWAAAICRAHKWSEKSVIGHKEWQPGKIDPSFDMAAFRARVKRLLAAVPGAEPLENGRPRYLALGMTKPFTLQRATWASPKWDAEWADPLSQHPAGGQTFLTAAQYSGLVHVRMDGLTPGKKMQVRLVEDDSSGETVQHYFIGEGVSAGGSTYLTMPICGKAPRGRHTKVQVRHFGERTVTVERCEVKAQVWPL